MKNKSLKALVIVATLIAGCSKESQTDKTTATATNNTTAIPSKSAEQQPLSIPSNTVSATTVPAQPPSEDQFVLVEVNCVVYHSGYRGIIVASGVSKPTGTIVSLECNGKNVEIANKAMADGIIETTAFGKLGVRFGSMVATVGAGDFTSVPAGSSLPERAIEVYVQKSKQKDFMAMVSK